MTIRTTEQTKTEFNKKFLLWKIENEKGTQEQFLLYLLAIQIQDINIDQSALNKFEQDYLNEKLLNTKLSKGEFLSEVIMSYSMSSRLRSAAVITSRKFKIKEN